MWRPTCMTFGAVAIVMLGHLAERSDVPVTPLAAAQPATNQPAATPPAQWRVDRHDLQRLARQIEPDLIGRPERSPQYIEFFRQRLANDPRLFAFDVACQVQQDGGLRLEGFVEFPETRGALVAFLRVLGLEPVDDRLEILPAAGLGTHRFGFLRVPHSLSYDRPAGRRQVVTDCLLGEPLYLLREDQGHVLVHSAEGYLGYVRERDIHRVDEASFAGYLAAPWVRVRSDQQTATGDRLPAGCRLRRIRHDGDQVVVELPTGETHVLAVSCCASPSDTTAQIDRAIDQARQLLGTPYLWGGKTSSGVDCSGLVQIAFAAAGIHLPRDSHQQFYLGQLTGTRWCTATMRRGDTLYFLGPHGKIRHTAIYLGDGHYLQAESPVVRISSLDPRDADYDAARHASFAFAKRLLD